MSSPETEVRDAEDGGTGAAARGQFRLEQLWGAVEAVDRVPTPRVAAHLVRRGLGNLVSTPLTSVLNVLAIGAVLALFGALLTARDALSALVSEQQVSVETRLYLREDTDEATAARLFEEIRSKSEVSSARFVTKAEALTELRERLGDQALVLEEVDARNPLPRSIRVTFSAAPDLAARAAAFAERYAAHPSVEHLQGGGSFVRQIGELLDVVRAYGGVLALAMLVVGAFLIGVTIRLSLYAHRREIQIMKLLGATDRHIRTPYIVEGALLGALGAAAALAALSAGSGAIGDALARVEVLRLMGVERVAVSAVTGVLLAVFGPLVGMAASAAAVRELGAEP